MILLVEEITGKKQRYAIEGRDWFPQDDESFFHTAKASVSVSRRDSETFLLKGKLEGKRRVACDRCSEKVEENLQSEFDYLVTTREEKVVDESDIECSDDDAIILYLKGPEIDVDTILREQAYLSFPLRTLCREDCKGVCAGCGTALNNGDCDCSLDLSGSAFAVLKKLKKS